MATDRELLEMAAKAAGLHWVMVGPRAVELMRVSPDGRQWSDWSPLTDDGDALRLALKLRLTITHQGKAVACFTVNADGVAESESIQPWDDDTATAARIAIVRAAASIGELKEPQQ